MPLRLGLCIPSGKKTRIGLPGRISKLCAENDIEIVEIDIDKSIDDQGPFDVLLHKVLDYFNDSINADEKVKKIMSYSVRHPNMIVLDNFQWCWRLTSRKLMAELIRACEFTLNGIKFFLPKTIDFTEDVNVSSVVTKIQESELEFPVVVKPYSAYFTDNARAMAVVFSPEGLKGMERPCLIQEFRNHSAVCYKVFVIGEKFHICERPSIKNLRQEKMEYNRTIYFNSFRVSKTGQSFCEELHEHDPNERNWNSSDEAPNLLDTAVVAKAISRIQQFTGLYLFGIDILVEDKTGNYAFIDINQFPSYKGIDEMHFPRNLVDLIKSFDNTSYIARKS